MPIPGATFVADLVTKTLNGRRRNRMYYGSAWVPESYDHMEHAANAIHDFFAPKFSALMDYSAFFEKVELQYISGGVEGFVGVSTKPAVQGGVAPDISELDEDDSWQLPDECSLIIRIATGKRGRSKQGRRFITGLSEAINKGGKIEPVYAPECIALATAIPAQIEVASNPTIEIAANQYLDARHYDRKNNVMEVLVKAWALDMIGSRIDRRKPLEASVLVTEESGA